MTQNFKKQSLVEFLIVPIAFIFVFLQNLSEFLNIKKEFNDIYKIFIPLTLLLLYLVIRKSQKHFPFYRKNKELLLTVTAFIQVVILSEFAICDDCSHFIYQRNTRIIFLAVVLTSTLDFRKFLLSLVIVTIYTNSRTAKSLNAIDSITNSLFSIFNIMILYILKNSSKVSKLGESRNEEKKEIIPEKQKEVKKCIFKKSIDISPFPHVIYSEENSEFICRKSKSFQRIEEKRDTSELFFELFFEDTQMDLENLLSGSLIKSVSNTYKSRSTSSKKSRIFLQNNPNILFSNLDKLKGKKLSEFCEYILKGIADSDLSLEKMNSYNYALKQLQSYVVITNTSRKSFRIFMKLFRYQKNYCVSIHFLKESQLLRDLKEEINHFQSKFLKSISHELRTPLNASIVLLTVSEEFTPSSSWNLYISPSLNSLKLLLHSLNDIFDYAALIKNDFHIEPKPLNLQGLIEDISNLIAPQLIGKSNDVDLKINIDENIQSIILNDPKRISQILTNLLSNSIRFTYKGKIIICATALNDNLISVAVRDTGPGVDPEKLNTLFDFNLDNEGMIGLGLNISNKLSRFLNKKKKGMVYSRVGIYSEFKFFLSNLELPVSEHQTENIVNCEEKTFSIEQIDFEDVKFISNLNEKTQKNQIMFSKVFSSGIEEDEEYKSSKLFVLFRIGEKFQLLSKMKSMKQGEKEKFLHSIDRIFDFVEQKNCKCEDILVVDDNDFNIYALTVALSKFNFQIASAKNGEIAYEAVQKKYQSNICCPFFRIIFMDVEMPIMDGLKATRYINDFLEEIDSKLACNIIGCSAFTTKEDINKCIENGMADFIPKPVALDTLEKILAKWFAVGDEYIREN